MTASDKLRAAVALLTSFPDDAPLQIDGQQWTVGDLRELEKLLAEQQWRPIETAPRSRRGEHVTWLELWWPARLVGAPITGYYSNQGDYWVARSGGHSIELGAGPTHWRPVPAGPKATP